MSPLRACLKLSEFEVQFLAFEDSFSCGSMVIEFLEGWTATRGFGKYPQVLLGVSVDHPSIIRCRTFAVGGIGLGGFVGTSPFLTIPILAVSGIIHLRNLG